MKVYPGGTRVVDGVSFAVGEGEFMGRAVASIVIVGLVLHSVTPWDFRRLTS